MVEIITDEKFEYHSFGVCLCCGRKFGINFAQANEKQIYFNYGCFLDKIGESCSYCDPKGECKNCRIEQKKLLTITKEEQIKYAIDKIIAFLKEDKEVLFHLDLTSKISLEIYEEITKINNEGKISGIIQKVKEEILIQIWNYSQTPYTSFFPKLPSLKI